jgi:hypothetical protein
MIGDIVNLILTLMGLPQSQVSRYCYTHYVTSQDFLIDLLIAFAHTHPLMRGFPGVSTSRLHGHGQVIYIAFLAAADIASKLEYSHKETIE